MKLKLFITAGCAVLVLVCMGSLMVGCEHTMMATVPVNPDPTSFSNIHANILQPRCVNQACHPGGGAPFSLARNVAYQNLVGVPSAQIPILNRVTPNQPDSSYLIQKLVGAPTYNIIGSRMPPGGNPLSQNDINNLRAWINRGAPND